MFLYFFSYKYFNVLKISVLILFVYVIYLYYLCKET